MLTPLKMNHAAALERFLRDFDARPDELHGYFCGRDWSIDRAAETLAAWGRGEQLQPGWVPCSTWFWESGGDLQGVINVRHHLTDSLRQIGGHIGYSVAPAHRRRGVASAMLAAVLPRCRALGIRRALLTCNAENAGSWKTIERNGGVLEREGLLESEGKVQRWYWIDLAAMPAQR